MIADTSKTLFFISDLSGDRSNRSILYGFDMHSGNLKSIGQNDYTLTNIACHETKLYGVTFSNLMTLNPNTGVAAFVGATGFFSINALASYQGKLYGATADGLLLAINTATGSATLAGSFGLKHPSGDIAFDEAGHVYTPVTTGATTHDALAKLEKSTNKARIIGDIGYYNVRGLAYHNSQLYGITRDGYVLIIDATTGKGTALHALPASQYSGLTVMPFLPQ